MAATLRWLMLALYLSLVVFLPYSDLLQENYDRVMQTFCFLALLGWSNELRKRKGKILEKIVLFALLGHSLWIALSDGKIECTETFARRESALFGTGCLIAILIVGGFQKWKSKYL